MPWNYALLNKKKSYAIFQIGGNKYDSEVCDQILKVEMAVEKASAPQRLLRY